jgi:glycosyltransferase involved in cell wall biosynthesis
MDSREETELHLNAVSGGGFAGCAGRKMRFGIRAFVYAISNPRSMAVVGHVGAGPVALVLRSAGLIRSYILVLHGIEAWRRLAWLDRRAALGAVRIVATTRYTAAEFCRQNTIPGDRLRVIPLAVAEGKVEQPDVSPKIRSHLSVLTVGRMCSAERYKGVDTLIRAAEKARGAGARVHLTVVGDGDDLPRLKGLVSEACLESHVSFVAGVGDDEVRRLYQDCDVFAMPSKGEGFGIAFLEAMRYGKPCIGGKHAGTPEVIDHGVNGYLVEHGDVGRLAQHLADLSERPSLRREMGRRAFDKLRSRYLFTHMQEQWFSLLDDVAAG